MTLLCSILASPLVTQSCDHHHHRKKIEKMLLLVVNGTQLWLGAKDLLGFDFLSLAVDRISSFHNRWTSKFAIPPASTRQWRLWLMIASAWRP